jgi:rRNA maturation endonuclease Nob1
VDQHGWEEYFEAVNGRKPTQDDIDEGIAKGELELSDPEDAENSSNAAAPSDAADAAISSDVAVSADAAVSAGSADAVVPSVASSLADNGQDALPTQAIPSAQPVAMPVSISAQSAQTVQLAQTAKFCTSCGAQIVPGGRFCKKCGAQVLQQSAVAQSGSQPVAAVQPVPATQVMPTAPAQPVPIQQSVPVQQSVPIQSVPVQPAPIQQTVPIQPIPTQSVSAAAQPPSAAGLFFTGLWAWIIGSIKAPWRDAPDAVQRGFCWISIVVTSLLGALVPATLAWRAVSAVSSYASDSLTNLFGESMMGLGGSVDQGTSTANGAVASAFFGMVIGLFVFNMALVLCIWMVRSVFLLGKAFSFDRALDLVARQYVLVALALLAAELFALIGVSVLVALALIVAIVIVAAIANFGVFQSVNHRKGNDFYLKLLGFVATTIILCIVVLLMSVLGLHTLIASL